MKQTKLVPPVDWLQERAREILEENDERKVEPELARFLDYYEPLNYSLAYDSGLWRARPCKDENGFGFFSEMHYPPAKCTTAGRANDSTSPLLYASFTQLTALCEVRVKAGDVVQVMAYKMDRHTPIRSFTLGEFSRVHLGGHGNLPDSVGKKLNLVLHRLKFEPGLSFVFLDAFLAALMSGREEHASGYVHSRILTRLIFQKYPSLEAIHYPSVARDGAMNIAIRPNASDRALKFIGTSVLFIEQTFDYGLCRFRRLKDATQLAEGDRFLWGAAHNP